MSCVQRLYELQLLDLETEEKSARLAAVEANLGESETLRSARAQVQEYQRELQAQESKARELEWQTEDLGGKIRQLDSKLYGGTVRNPKELSALQREVEVLRHQHRRLEDQELEVMVAIEELQARLQSSQVDLAQTESQWRAQQERWQAEREQLLQQLSALQESRSVSVAGVHSQCLTTYEELRKTKRGRAVARVEQNTCQGCRITLPSHEVQRARTSPGLVFCSSCGRILWASR